MERLEEFNFDESMLVGKKGIVDILPHPQTKMNFTNTIDLETAKTLVRERAAIVKNNHCVLKLYNDKQFKKLIHDRDKRTCHYCGKYAHTIDHIVPRARGGRSTPENCVSCCYRCNQ